MRDMSLSAGSPTSMVWMPMHGGTWAGAAAAFMGMWSVMTAAMMLPTLAPMLWRYRRALGRVGGAHLGLLTALVGGGYMFVWTVAGIAVYPMGAFLAAIAKSVPASIGVVVLLAGTWQLTTWKARHLACCRQLPSQGRPLRADAATAWRHGVRLGLHCSRCCANLMAVPLVIGLMDVRAMAVVGAAISIERLAPSGDRVARAIGIVIVGGGLYLLMRATSGPSLLALHG